MNISLIPTVRNRAGCIMDVKPLVAFCLPLCLCPRVPDVLGCANMGVDSTASTLINPSLCHEKQIMIEGEKTLLQKLQ